MQEGIIVIVFATLVNYTAYMHGTLAVLKVPF